MTASFSYPKWEFLHSILLHSGIMHWILFNKSMSFESEALLRMPSSNTINALQATHTSTILFYLTVCLLNIIHLSGKHQQMCYSCKLLIELPTSQSVCISIAINGCRQYDQIFIIPDSSIFCISISALTFCIYKGIWHPGPVLWDWGTLICVLVYE